LQFVGIGALVFGYACVYTAGAMLKRAGGAQSGNVLYWLTGIADLGAPSGSSQTGPASAGRAGKPTKTPAQGPASQRTGRGTHSQ
jgi:hypothetical protein